MIKFIPPFPEEFKFEDFAEDLNIEGETLESIKMYDEAKHLMQRQGDEANDYLRNMVQNNEGFADRDERAKPLKTFYTLVPAITINYLKHVV